MQCKGCRRIGGILSFGPVRWIDCKNEATVMLTVIQEGNETEMPACNTCWAEGLKTPAIQIKNAVPILEEEKQDAKESIKESINQNNRNSGG